MASDPFISICIPAYEMDGKGGEFLLQSFEQLLQQSFGGFEIVVSDQSRDDGVRTICKAYADRLDIRHVDFRNGPRQVSSNANNAMIHARGKVLKLLFQDDYLCQKSALQQHADAFRVPRVTWLLCGSMVAREGNAPGDSMMPRLNPNLHLGTNTVSSPSVLSLRAEAGMQFDENLSWLMDVEFYKRCADTLGAPYILADPLVVNRLHPGQLSARIPAKDRRYELRHVRTKHRADETLGNRFHYYKQLLKAR